MNKVTIHRIPTIIGLGVLAIGVIAGVWFFQKNQPGHTIVSTLERSLSPQDLASESSLVLIGTFVSSRTWTSPDPADKGLSFLAWTVEPKEVWKGTLPSPLEVVVLDTHGPVTTGESMEVAKRGVTGLMYLTYAPAVKAWVLLSTTQGFFTQKNGVYTTPVGRSFNENTLKTLVNESVTKVQVK